MSLQYRQAPLSVVIVRRRCAHSLNIFASKTVWQIKVKFHIEPPWDGGKKVCSNSPGHMTKMASTPIYGKNLKKSSSPEPKGRWPWKLVCRIGCSSTTKFVQMKTLSWPWPILQQGQIWPLMPLYGKKVNNGFFRKYYSLWFETSSRWPKWQEVLLTSKHFPLGGCMPTAPGYIHVLNHEKNCIKSDFKEISSKLATNG